MSSKDYIVDYINKYFKSLNTVFSISVIDRVVKFIIILEIQHHSEENFNEIETSKDDIIEHIRNKFNKEAVILLDKRYKVFYPETDKGN